MNGRTLRGLAEWNALHVVGTYRTECVARSAVLIANCSMPKFILDALSKGPSGSSFSDLISLGLSSLDSMTHDGLGG